MALFKTIINSSVLCFLSSLSFFAFNRWHFLRTSYRMECVSACVSHTCSISFFRLQTTTHISICQASFSTYLWNPDSFRLVVLFVALYAFDELMYVSAYSLYRMRNVGTDCCFQCSDRLESELLFAIGNWHDGRRKEKKQRASKRNVEESVLLSFEMWMIATGGEHFLQPANAFDIPSHNNLALMSLNINTFLK